MEPGSSGTSDLSPNDVSPSGPLDNSSGNQDNIESFAPGSLNTEELHGGLDSYGPRLGDNGKDTQPAPLDTSGQHNIPSGDVEDLWMQETIHLDNLRTSTDFVKVLRQITLDDPMLSMSSDAIEHLRNPPCEAPSLSIDTDTRMALELFLNDPSEKAYKKSHGTILRRHPDDILPSYYKTKHFVADLTGIESIVHHMCINSCIAYMGPFSDLGTCPVCSEPWYDLSGPQSSSRRERKPHQTFHTIPVGPQIQALYQDPKSASHAHYLCKERARILSEIEQKQYLDKYSDMLHGADMIQVFQDGRIGEYDIALMFSIDSAQLYAHKLSACWIYIWVL